MDYSAKMLSLYFKENHFTKKEIEEALESNPFNVDYVIWEKRKRNTNKSLAINLKRDEAVFEDDIIQEITVHEENAISRYIDNKDTTLRVCSARDSIKDIRLNRNKVLISGLFYDEYELVERLHNRRIEFVLGIATKDRDLYKEYVNFANKVASNMQPYYVKKYIHSGVNLCIVKK